MARLPEPPCGALADIANAENLRDVIEVVKWPNCSESDRSELIHKISEIAGQSFGTKIKGRFVADKWSFINWAEKQGFDLSSPPQRYPPH
jgi:hypothetical protein